MPTTSLKPEEPILQITTARIQILDILRGMALMGILIIHIATGMHWMFASPEQKALMPFPEINAILGPAIDFFFIDKSRTLFAFMFGLTFFIQLKSAEHHKNPFKRVFLWRLTILMILGLLHGHLIYGGDILRYYAVGGLLLLFVYNWSSRSLLILGFFLNIGIPIITTIVSILFEINLFGEVLPIGGLRDKMYGAKLAGIKHVLFPYNNMKDYDKILQECPDLICESFEASSISTIQDAIELLLLPIESIK